MTEPVQLPIDDLIRELSSEIMQIHRWMAEQAGLNTTDLLALYYIRNAEGQAAPKQLAENLGLTSGATAILLNRLEQRGLIQRSPHPSDRRAVLLSLGPAATAEGILHVRQYLREANADVFDTLGEQERGIVVKFLGDMLENTRKALHDLRTSSASK
ncbi:MarR family transcriptional regulator [Devosia sp. MC532]|uniref:MarR family winged helix-turn-helix transcriptional regulator n=1 Tax=Devosia sp. MC532 TaxID=2799788 RepID=UPI0018F32E49|nr:MarR family transcriptional regulator [Devosia sp. MC532]MBJ7579053.1 MarR family transcriptional regulator [Devosia sp. MC532]